MIKKTVKQIDMKKMLIFQPTVGSYRVDLYNYLSTLFKVTIYLEYFKSDSEIYDSSESNRLLALKPYLLEKHFKLGHRQLYKGYFKAIKSTDPDIVLVSEFGLDAISSILYKWLFRKKYKIISICDDSSHMLHNHMDFSIFHKITRRLITPFLDDIILVEPAARDWYNKRYGKGYYFPIISDEYRIRVNLEKALPKSKEYIQKYGLKDKNIFLYVGRLVKVKNVDFLINGFCQLNSQNAKLIIVGEGDQSEALKAKAFCNKNIIFVGRQVGEALNVWYNIADALILPSVIEPFGAVTNEALIAGCKVIVSRNAGSRCLVEEGINGDLVDPDNLQDLILKLKKTLANEKKSHMDCKQLRPTLMLVNFHDVVQQLCDHINK